MITQTQRAHAVTKVIREKAHQIFLAVRMEVPSYIDDNTLFVRFVDAAFKNRREKCTRRVFLKCQGNQPKQRRRHTGLDFKHGHRFILRADESKTVTSIDCYPYTEDGTGGQSFKPMRTTEHLVVEIQPDGALHATEVPDRMLESKIHRLFNALSALDSVEFGAEIGGFRVVDIAGMTVSFEDSDSSDEELQIGSTLGAI